MKKNVREFVFLIDLIRELWRFNLSVNFARFSICLQRVRLFLTGLLREAFPPSERDRILFFATGNSFGITRWRNVLYSRCYPKTQYMSPCLMAKENLFPQTLKKKKKKSLLAFP